MTTTLANSKTQYITLSFARIDASTLVSAILTGYQIGLHGTIDEAIAAAVKFTAIITSSPKNCEVYNRIYPRFTDIFLQTAMETKI